MQPTSRNMDQRWPRGNRLLHTKLFKAKKFRNKQPKKAKSKPAPQASSQSGNAEISEKAWKKKQNKQQQEKQENQKRSNLNCSTPATGSNMRIGSKIKKKPSQNRGQQQDLNLITCWNCNKKSYYSHKCPKLPRLKNQHQSWRPPH